LWVLQQLGLPASACLAFEDSANGLKASLGAGLPTLVTISEYTQDHDFAGALAVLSDLGEQGRPSVVRSGTMHGRTLVDLDLLKIWHREAIRENL
jgi:beta-phosphoglucomutase-like phosphatase (HAD superfamily)